MKFPGRKSRSSTSIKIPTAHDEQNDATNWVDREINESAFKDARLGKRFRELLIRMGGGIGESIPLACQD